MDLELITTAIFCTDVPVTPKPMPTYNMKLPISVDYYF